MALLGQKRAIYPEIMTPILIYQESTRKTGATMAPKTLFMHKHKQVFEISWHLFCFPVFAGFRKTGLA